MHVKFYAPAHDQRLFIKQGFQLFSASHKISEKINLKIPYTILKSKGFTNFIPQQNYQTRIKLREAAFKARKKYYLDVEILECISIINKKNAYLSLINTNIKKNCLKVARLGGSQMSLCIIENRESKVVNPLLESLRNKYDLDFKVQVLSENANNEKEYENLKEINEVSDLANSKFRIIAKWDRPY